MNELLCELLARRAWEAMNPGGAPWEFLPKTEIKSRMRIAMQDVLVLMVGLDAADSLTLSKAQAKWLHQ